MTAETRLDLVVDVCLPMLNTGGTEVSTLTLVRVLVDAGCRVRVLSYYEAEADVASAFRATGAEVVWLRRQRGRGVYGSLREYLGLVACLHRLFRRRRPDVVHVQYVAPGLAPLLAARLAGVRRVLATVHQPGHPYGTFARLLFRLAALLTHCFTCVSEAVARSWFGRVRPFPAAAGEGLPSHVVLYNAVDTAAFAAVDSAAATVWRSRLDLSPSTPVIGVVSRLHRLKGIDTLVAASAALGVGAGEACVVVVGDGPAAADLRRLAADCGVAAGFRWAGRRSSAEVRELLSLMDVVVVPSRLEGLGLSAVEAGAARRPVVASAIDGLREVIVDGQTGVLTPPDDAAALAAAVKRLLDDAPLRRRMGSAAAARVREVFGLERFRRCVSQLYAGTSAAVGAE